VLFLTAKKKIYFFVMARVIAMGYLQREPGFSSRAADQHQQLVSTSELHLVAALPASINDFEWFQYG